MASGSVSSKWKRTSTDKVALYSLSDLPSGILAHTASFLAAPSSPSRALFAIALDENSAVIPNERSSAIIGDSWDVLDFGDIEQDVAARLSDADIEKVLLCVDAVGNSESVLKSALFRTLLCALRSVEEALKKICTPILFC